MSIPSQDIRFGEEAGDNNPLALYDFIKPTRLISSPFPPQASFGENFWWYIDTSANTLYIKKQGTWEYEYTFGGGIPVPDITGATNVGGQNEVFKEVLGTDLIFRTIKAGDNISITQEADTLTINADTDPTNVLTDLGSSGSGTYSLVANPSKIGTVGQIKKLSDITGSLTFIDSATNLSIKVNQWDLFITGGSNLGLIGSGVFSGVVGRTMNFKRLESTTGKITRTDSTNTIDLGVNLTKDDVQLNWVQNIANGQGNLTFPPSVNSDTNMGYVAGSIWVENGASISLWVCENAAAGAAVWVKIVDSSIPPTTFMKEAFFISGGNGQAQSIGSPAASFISTDLGGYAIRTLQGNWQILDLGGNMRLARRNSATDGLTNDLYLITMNLSFDTLSVGDRAIYVALYVGTNFSNPVSGSTALMVFPIPTPGADQRIYTSVSHTFQYRATTAGILDLQFGWRYPNAPIQGAFVINIRTLDLIITQI